MATQGYYKAASDEPAEYVFERVPNTDHTYLLTSRIRYVDKDGMREWITPKRRSLETDLTSIPFFASWLVPKDGLHTPAALIHDAMILDEGEEYPNYEGPQVSAEDADRIFREGMQHLGVRFLRRWMMWAAVSILTIWRGAFQRPLGFVRLATTIVGAALFLTVGLFLVPDALDFPSWTDYKRIPEAIPGAFLVRPFHMFWTTGRETGEWARVVTVVGWSIAAYTLAWLCLRQWRFGLTLGLSFTLLSYAMFVPFLAYIVYLVAEELLALLLYIPRLWGGGDPRGRVPSRLLYKAGLDRDPQA